MENKIIDILRDHGLYEYPYTETAAIEIQELIEEFYQLKRGKYETGS